MVSEMIRDLESSDVRAALVVGVGRIRRVNEERILYVGVVRPSTESLKLPHGWHFDTCPSRTVERRRLKSGRRFKGGVDEIKLPFSGETMDFGLADVS